MNKEKESLLAFLIEVERLFRCWRYYYGNLIGSSRIPPSVLFGKWLRETTEKSNIDPVITSSIKDKALISAVKLERKLEQWKQG